MLPPRILVPLIVATGLFMENMDSAVIATALPSIARDMGADPIHLKLAVTSYLLSLAVFIPISGWMADTFGARTIFRAAMIVFTLGSIGCGLSTSIEQIVAARILQGLGGSMMTPVGRLVLLRSVTKAEVVSAFAWLSIPSLTGPVFGPLLSGFFTTYFTWRWIFWINVPICLLGIVLSTLYIPQIKSEHRARFDLPGFLLLGSGLALVVTGATAGGVSSFMPRMTANLLLLTGAVLVAIYVWHARRTEEPILDLRLFRVPSFRLTMIGGSLFRVGVGASPFLLPLLLQVGFGFTAMQSGAITFASAGGALMAKSFTVRAIRMTGFRTLLLGNGIICALLVAAPASFSPGMPALAIIAVLFITGLLRSLQFTSINALAFADIDQKRMSQATSINGVMQQISQSLGVTVGALVLEFALGGRHGSELTAAEFVPAFATVAVISGLCIAPFLRLSPTAGDEVSGKKRRAI
jgi:EmrB/QacA subfamily drug resistance transporter